MSKFILEKSYAGHYWKFKASNNETICHSEIYNSKQAALNGIASCKENAKTLSNFTLFLGSDNQHYWNLKARNGEKLCHSEGYTSKAGANNFANFCHRDAPVAETLDRTLMTV